MSKIYTRTGDRGETALFDGARLRKDDIRLATIGTFDELNAMLGMVRAECADWQAPPVEIDSLLERLQHQLFDLGAELAMPDPDRQRTDPIGRSQVSQFEAAIDQFDAQLEPLREFILPGGCPAAAQLHLARGICRRAERLLVTLMAEKPIRNELLCYVNRLSDLLFVLARAANRAAQVPDITWRHLDSGPAEG